MRSLPAGLGLALLVALLALGALAPGPVRAGEYKVIYLNYEARHVEAGRNEPIVLEDGLTLSDGKALHAPKGCPPLKPCYGTFEIPVLGAVLDAMHQRNWELVSVQPVTEGPLKGGYLAFLKRRPLPAPPRP